MKGQFAGVLNLVKVAEGVCSERIKWKAGLQNFSTNAKLSYLSSAHK